jgi:hypothetical protein
MERRQLSNPVIVAAVVVAAWVGFVWGRGPVRGLGEQLTQSEQQIADIRESQQDAEAKLDAFRILLVETLASVEGTTRLVAESATNGAFVQGSYETCQEILGGNEPRCDNIFEAYTHQSYPGDPGYVPEQIAQSIGALSEGFDRLRVVLCDTDNWPYVIYKGKGNPLLEETCDRYDAMVGKMLIEGQ